MHLTPLFFCEFSMFNIFLCDKVQDCSHQPVLAANYEHQIQTENYEENEMDVGLSGLGLVGSKLFNGR